MRLALCAALSLLPLRSLVLRLACVARGTHTLKIVRLVAQFGCGLAVDDVVDLGADLCAAVVLEPAGGITPEDLSPEFSPPPR